MSFTATWGTAASNVTANLVPAVWVKAHIESERVPFWSMLPWPTRRVWWAEVDCGEHGVGFVIANRREDLGREIVDMARFMYDDETLTVGWTASA